MSHKSQRTTPNPYRVKMEDFTNCPKCGVSVKVTNLDGHMKYNCSTKAWKQERTIRRRILREDYRKEHEKFYKETGRGLFKRFKDWMDGK